MKAWIDHKHGVGYVVMVSEGITHTPLRNFGDMLSAAFEFRNWLNQCVDERLPRWVKLYADTYNPTEKFSYPVFKGNDRPTLKRQRAPRSAGED